jgi:hypothetical protein
MTNQWKPATDLSRAYCAYKTRVRNSIQPQLMEWIEADILDGIEKLAQADRNSRIAGLHARLMDLLGKLEILTTGELRSDFEKVYREAERLAFRASTAYVAQGQALVGWTQNHSLTSVDLKRLRALDMKSHSDPTINTFVADMSARLSAVVSPPDVILYSQFFEIYGEALTYEFLSAKLRTRRMPEAETKTPDFECRTPDDKVFYVEVKTLDIVGGEFRHDQIMVDSVDRAVDLRRQLAAGETIAMSEGEVAPYKRFGETDTYDPRSLVRVIDVLRDKCWQAFKLGQFALGPTFALAITSRLIVPAGKCALAPYYFDPHDGGTCVSGVLWQSAFGYVGTPILRWPDFPGKPTLEAHLAAPGLFVDEGRRFPGLGLIALSFGSEGDAAFGLYPARYPPIADWGPDETLSAIVSICEAFNDDENSQAFNISQYSSARAAPRSEP